MKRIEQLRFSRDEVSLRELLQVLHSARWLIIAVTTITTLLGGIVALVMPPQYEATALISPVSNNDNPLGTLSSLASQFSGLASLAGISMTGSTKSGESLAILESRALTEKYITTQNLLPVLFKNKWDSEKKQWKDARPNKIPTLWEANKRFDEEIRSVTSANGGLIELTITWKDRMLAAKWANDLVRETNEYLRAKALAESERNIAFLRDLISKTDLVAVRDAISSILENEINKDMLARGTADYALKVLDPAVPPERQQIMPKVSVVLGAALGGLFLSVLFVLLRASIR
jgi:uncharacterized protein involved in exopolysaccharide biosynthesis